MSTIMLMEKKRAESQKWWGLQNLWWVPFSIHLGVDNKDEARLSTTMWFISKACTSCSAIWIETCHDRSGCHGKSRSWCHHTLQGLGCRKAGEMLLNVQCGHMELLLLRKTTCFFWRWSFIYFVWGHENLYKMLMRKVSWTPRGRRFRWRSIRYIQSFGIHSDHDHLCFIQDLSQIEHLFSSDRGEIRVLNLQSNKRRLCFRRKRVMLFCSWYGLLESCFGVSCHAEQKCGEPVCVVSLEGPRTDLQMPFHYKWNFPKFYKIRQESMSNLPKISNPEFSVFFLWKVLAASNSSKIWLTKMRHGSIWAVAFWHPDGPDAGIRVESSHGRCFSRSKVWGF